MEHQPVEIPHMLTHGLTETEVSRMSHNDLLIRFLKRHAEEHPDPDKAILQDFERAVISRGLELEKESEDSHSQKENGIAPPPSSPSRSPTSASLTPPSTPPKPLAQQLYDDFNLILKSEKDYNEPYSEEELKAQLSPLLYSIIQSNVQEFQRDYAQSPDDPSSLLRISYFISFEHAKGKEKKNWKFVEPEPHSPFGMVTPNLAFLHD